MSENRVLHKFKMSLTRGTIYIERTKDTKKAVPRKEWCGIRDVFAHQYSNLDHGSAWETTQHDLPELKAVVNGILKGDSD